MQNNKQIIKQYCVFQSLAYLLSDSLRSSSALQLQKQTHCIGWGLSAQVQRLKFNESLDVLLSSYDGQPVRVGVQFQTQVQAHCHAFDTDSTLSFGDTRYLLLDNMSEPTLNSRPRRARLWAPWMRCVPRIKGTNSPAWIPGAPLLPPTCILALRLPHSREEQGGLWELEASPCWLMRLAFCAAVIRL